MTKLTLVQDQAIQALMAGVVGAETFDRLFAGIRFDKIDGTMLYAFAKDEEVASDIEDGYSSYIAAVAARRCSVRSAGKSSGAPRSPRCARQPIS